MQVSPRLHTCVQLTTAGLCGAGALLIRLTPDAELHWRLLQEPLQAIGLIIVLLALLRNRPGVARVTSGLCVSLLTLSCGVAAVETAGRLTGFDFRGLEAARRRLPPFYRKPSVLTGGAFLRRPGPDQWTGQVIRQCLEALELPGEAYRKEPVVTVRYDRWGFRNEGVGSAWDLAVAGDSFTELGFLPYPELFTTILGRLTGWRVLNLGVSYTGPLTQLSYLEEYGLSVATRQTVIVFYEGNDLEDLDREYGAWLQYRTTGRYEPDEARKETSLLRALGEWIARSRPEPPRNVDGVEAYWPGPQGEIPITLGDTPPAAAQLSAVNLSRLEFFLDRYAGFARRRGVRGWLAYMPCKARVVFGKVRLARDAGGALRAWIPGDLPRRLGELCGRRGIEFVDLTPPLVEATRAGGPLLFNALYDSHLNARGSEVVARALAAALTRP